MSGIKQITAFALLSIFLAVSVENSFCEDLNEIFKKVNEFVSSKNYPKAIEELGWAKKEIEKLHVTQLKGFFPDELAGFTGGKVETNAILGFTALERDYTKTGESAHIKVSLTGGGSGNDAGGLGGLAAIGKMAAMMEGAGQGNNETFRISGRTATLDLNEDSNRGELTVFLDSGSILKFEMDNGATGETLKTLAQAVKIEELDKYLKGTAG